MKPDEIKLGYMVIATPVPNTYVGGVMVTDGHGLPVEFRYTEPIQPTKIQQILYGQVLSNYIKREVILETLLKSLETKFTHLLVQDDALLNISDQGFTLIRLSETQTPNLGEVGETEAVSDTEQLLQSTPGAAPIRLQSNSALSGINSPIDYLKAACHSMDLYEPMKRVEKALTTICQEAGVNGANAA